MVKLPQQIKDSICQIFENDKDFVTCSVMDKGDICYIDLVHERPGLVIGRNGRDIKVLSTIISTISKKNPEIHVMDTGYKVGEDGIRRSAHLHQKRKRMFARQQEILAQYSMEVMA